MKPLPNRTCLWLSAVLFVLSMSTASLLWFGDAWARPYRMGKIPASRLGCGACHVNPNGGGPRNSFGDDYAVVGLKAGDTYTDALSAKDSDGDGYTNAQEFEAGSHPGDPNSKPVK